MIKSEYKEVSNKSTSPYKSGDLVIGNNTGIVYVLLRFTSDEVTWEMMMINDPENSNYYTYGEIGAFNTDYFTSCPVGSTITLEVV